MFESLLVAAPAKINLTLDVLGKRPDGYHELETTMQQIDLVDWIFLETTAAGIEVSGSNPQLPNDEKNLVFQAARNMWDRFKLPGGVRIIIDKVIPMEAGLAGGSSDAAAVIKGIDRLLSLHLSVDELMEIGAEIGSDVPFCIQGGAALVRGRGEKVQALPDGPEMYLILVKPEFSITTAWVYQELNIAEIKNRPDTVYFLEAWRHCDIINMCKYMNNVLETVSDKKYPQISVIKAALLANGALGAWMSGSGSSVFGVYPDIDTAFMALARLKAVYKEVFLVSSCPASNAR